MVIIIPISSALDIITVTAELFAELQISF